MDKNSPYDTVFISSRMNELAIDRRIAFSTCHYLGFRSLMFEMEPIDDLKKKINDMIEVSDYFIGLYFKTVGVRNYELYRMSPIEYEIAYFIRRKCPKNSKCDKREEKCLSRIRDIITGHYGDFFDKNNDMVYNLSTGDIDNCKEAFESARPNIRIFCKYFNDEHAMSPQLLAFLTGMIRAGVLHVDYEDEWDLSRKIAKEYSDEISTKGIAEKDTEAEKEYLLIFKGKDREYQLKEFSKYAFFHHINIERLIVYSADNKTSTYAILRNFSLKAGELTSAEFRERLTDGVANRTVKKNGKTVYLFDRDGMNEEPEKETIEVLQIKNGPPEETVKAEQELEKAEKSFGCDDIIRKKCEGGLRDRAIIIVRLYHLNVPGLIYNVTKVLVGDEPFGCPIKFNIERCLTRKRAKQRYHIAYEKDKKRVGEDEDMYVYPVSYDYFMHEDHQVTEMVLSWKKDDFENGDMTLTRVIELESTLGSIIGVIRVIISKEISVDDSDGTGLRYLCPEDRFGKPS